MAPQWRAFLEKLAAMPVQETSGALAPLSIEEGRQAKHAAAVIAGTQPDPVLPPEHLVFCPKCGMLNWHNNLRCTNCGFVLHGLPQAPAVAVDTTMGGLVPVRNPAAVWAYYLGVFSLIPCIGLPLGIAAIILGARGLRAVNTDPQVKGKGHSLTGVIVGGLITLLYVTLFVIVLARS